jgi:hypothetical protein
VKSYDYKALMQACIDADRMDYVHEDFERYYKGLLESLKSLFQISFTSTDFAGKDERIRRISSLILFGASVRNYNAISHPWSGWLEGPLHVDDVWDKYGHKLLDLNRESKETVLALMDELFQIMYGRVDKIVTSEMLLEIGFDDSKEPKISDYYDYF